MKRKNIPIRNSTQTMHQMNACCVLAGGHLLGLVTYYYKLICKREVGLIFYDNKIMIEYIQPTVCNVYVHVTLCKAYPV